MPGSPLPLLAHPVLTPLPTPSLSGSTIPRPPTGRSHATHPTLTVTMGQLRCGWPIPWDSPRRPVPATLSSLGGEPATPGKADAHPAAGCPVLPGRMQPSACSRASVRWASDPEHLPLWERVPNPARAAQLRTLVLQAGVWAGPRRGWAGRGGAHPEAVGLLSVQHRVQGHLPGELVYGEDASRLLVHTRPLDTVDDAAQLLFVRLDLRARKAAGEGAPRGGVSPLVLGPSPS